MARTKLRPMKGRARDHQGCTSTSCGHTHELRAGDDPANSRKRPDGLRHKPYRDQFSRTRKCSSWQNLGMSLKAKKSDRQSSVINRRGIIALPTTMPSARLGKKLYFSISKAGVLISTKPKLWGKGRYASTRIKRCVRSLAAYGPRSRMIEQDF